MNWRYCIVPSTRTTIVYTPTDQSQMLGEVHSLDGRDVLPGFTLPLRKLFAELDASTSP
jgi:hypothetical protein